MNQELRGRLLAHIMFGELEKIAGIKEVVVKAISKPALGANVESRLVSPISEGVLRKFTPKNSPLPRGLPNASNKVSKPITDIIGGGGSAKASTKVPTSLTAPKPEATLEQLTVQQNSLEAQANVAEQKYLSEVKKSGFSSPEDIAWDPKLMELHEEAEKLRAEAKAIGKKITSMKSTPTSTSPKTPDTPPSIKGGTSPEVPEVNPGSSVAMGPASGSTTTRLTEEQTKAEFEKLIEDLGKATTTDEINRIKDAARALDPTESYTALKQLRAKYVEARNAAKSRVSRDVPTPPTSRPVSTSTSTSTPTAETPTSIPKPAEGSTSTAVGASKSETALSAEQRKKISEIDDLLAEFAKRPASDTDAAQQIVRLNNERNALLNSTPSTGKIPEFSLDNVKTVLTGPMLDSLPTEVATKVRAQAPNGFITSSNAAALGEDARNALQEAGVVISNMDDATAASIQAFKANPDKLPTGKIGTQDAFSIMDDGLIQYSIVSDTSGDIIHARTGEVIGKDIDGMTTFFTPAERSQNNFISRMTDMNKYSRQGLSTLEEGAKITANDISKASVSNGDLVNDIKTFEMNGKQYAYDRKQARVIGEQTTDGTIVGVNAEEASNIQQRLSDSYAEQLRTSNFNVGKNGLYNPEDIAKMDDGLKRQIPRSEGGLGVKTIEDFKQLETEALNAERIANEMRGTEQGVIFGSKGRLTPELEAQQKQLREEYREARKSLIIEYQNALTAHHKGTTPLSEEAFRKIEGDLKYLKQREVPYFNSNTLYGNTKGLRSPETPGGILGNKGGTLATGLGLGAVGTIGAMSLLGGDNKQEEQYDPYAGQY